MGGTPIQFQWQYPHPVPMKGTPLLGRWGYPPIWMGYPSPRNVNRQTPVKTVPSVALRTRAVKKECNENRLFELNHSLWYVLTYLYRAMRNIGLMRKNCMSLAKYHVHPMHWKIQYLIICSNLIELGWIDLGIGPGTPSTYSAPDTDKRGEGGRELTKLLVGVPLLSSDIPQNGCPPPLFGDLDPLLFESWRCEICWTLSVPFVCLGGRKDLFLEIYPSNAMVIHAYVFKCEARELTMWSCWRATNWDTQHEKKKRPKSWSYLVNSSVR